MTASPIADPSAKRRLGPADLQVTPLCIGCAPLGDMPDTFAYSVSDEQALATLRVAFRHPINFMETGAFDAVITHNRYSLLNRSADPLLEIAAQRGLAVLNAAPYGSGILAKGPDAYPRYAYQEASDAMIESVRRMAAVCKRYNVPLA